jgi:hypothetical protein
MNKVKEVKFSMVSTKKQFCIGVSANLAVNWVSCCFAA